MAIPSTNCERKRGWTGSAPNKECTMARNASANEDIPYKYTIDEIRLRVISDLQENYKMYKSYLVLSHMEEAK